MDKRQSVQKDSSAKRSRSPEIVEETATPRSSPTAQPPPQQQVPLKKRRMLRLVTQSEDEPPTGESVQTPKTVLPDTAVLPTPAIAQPQQPAAPSVVSTQTLSTNNLLLNFLKTLSPGFNIAKAIEDIQADLTSIDFISNLADVRHGEDEGASTPAVDTRDEILDTRSGDDQQKAEEIVRSWQEEAQGELPIDQGGETGFPSHDEEIAEVGQDDLTSVKGVNQPVVEAGQEEERQLGKFPKNDLRV